MMDDLHRQSIIMNGMLLCEEAVRNQPPAQPQRMRGRYIGTEYDGYADGCPVYYEWKCSVCGCTFEDEEPNYNFCPNCGADMRGEQNDN